MALAAAVSVSADDQFWVGGASGDWSDPSWAATSGGAGAAWTDGNNAVFDSGAPASVAVDSDVAAGKVTSGIDTTLYPGVLEFSYFRFVVDAVRDSSAGFQVGEIELFDGDGQKLVCGTDFSVAPSATVGVGGWNDSPYTQAFDGNTQTKWGQGVDNGQLPMYVDFTMNSAVRISRYRWWTGGDTDKYSGRNMKTWKLQASVDGTTWVTLDAVVGDESIPTSNSSIAYERSFVQTVYHETYAQYRLQIDAIRSGSTIQISEVEFYDGDGKKLALGTDFEISGRSDGINSGDTGETSDMLFDGKTSTKWCQGTSGAIPGWIELTMNSPVRISKYNWWTANDTNNSNGNKGRNPKSWQLLASNDNGATWTVIDQMSDNSNIRTDNKTKAYERQFLPVKEAQFSLSIGEIEVSDGKVQTIAGVGVGGAAGISKTGAGTLKLSDMSVTPALGFSTDTGVLYASNVVFRLGGTATDNADAPFVVGRDGSATAVMNGGSIYSLAPASGAWTATEIGSGNGGAGYLYATNLNLTSRGRLRLATGENSTGVVEKVGGAWTVEETGNYGSFYTGVGLNSSSEFYHRGGTLETWSWFCIGANGNSTSGRNYFELSGGTVTQGHYNDVRIGDNGGIGVHNELCVKGGVFNARADIRVGSGAPGVLTVDGGEVNAAGGRVMVACSGDAGEDASFALNGGVVRTKSVAHGNGYGINNATFTFNGGTLKAVESRTIIEPSKKLTVVVGANGGMIDASGFEVTVAEDLSGTGGMTFKGGGIVTLEGSNTYAGTNTVEIGTTLRVASQGELAGGLAVVVPATAPADAVYTVATLTGEGTFDGFQLPVAPANSTIRLSADRKSVLCIYGNPPNTWIGGASGSLSDDTKWSRGFVPTSGNAWIFCSSSATLTKGDEFAPDAITFMTGCADVTINGEGALAGIVAVTNLSASSHTINVPVCFAGDIQVVQPAMGGNGDLSKAHVTFAGGAHAAPGHAIENGDFSPVYSRCMFGHYYLYPTAESPWTALYQDKGNRPCLADNSSLTVPYAGSMHELYVGYGSVVTAGVSTVSNIGGQQRFCTWNNGEMVVTNELFATNPAGTGVNDSFAFLNRYADQSANVFKIEKATCQRNDGWTFWFGSGNGSASRGTYYFGSGGIGFGSGRGYFGFGRDQDNDEQTVRPWCGDVTFNHGSGNDHDIWAWRNIVFNTDDASGIGRTITLDAVLRFARTPTFTVAGSGKVLVTRSASNETQPTVTVKDSATLAFKPGTSLTTKTITVNDHATLAVAESGTVTLGGGLTLADGATLAFNYTERRSAPVLAVSSATADGTVKVAVSGKWPKGRTQVLTSGGAFSSKSVELAAGAPRWAQGVRVNEDGNIVLDVMPMTIKVIVK